MGIYTCQVTIAQARSVTAHFDPSLTVSTQGAGTGTVTSNPPGINCGPELSGAFRFHPTFVELAATPDSASVFTGWSGDCTGTGACQIADDEARSVTRQCSLRRPIGPTDSSDQHPRRRGPETTPTAPPVSARP